MMLFEVKKLHDNAIQARDGEVGRVDELLFDDESWTIRYLVVDTGSWLTGRKVLISPRAFGFLDGDARTIHLNLTREKIENSPGIETDQPVSRQWEVGYYDYHAWPYYWDAAGTRADPTRSHGDDSLASARVSDHLRSTRGVTGYGISAADGHLGHIQDCLVDLENWRIAYLVADTRDWWPGKKVLLPLTWIDRVDWLSGAVTVHVTREQVKNAPEWDASQPVNPACEEQIGRFHDLQHSGSKMPH